MWAEMQCLQRTNQHRFKSNRCRGVSHTPSRERKRNQRANQHSPKFNRTGVGAYRIRPHVGENETMATNMSPSTNVLFRRREGVCDTPLHLFGHFTDDMMTEPDDLTCLWRTHHHRRTCFFAAVKGVCDTPLQFLAYFMGNTMAERTVLMPT